MPEATTRPASVVLPPEDVRPDLSTRESPVRWVMLVDPSIGPGLAANAAGCMAAAVGRALPGLLGPDAADASGTGHPGLPWTGCAVLAAGPEEIRAVRAKALARDGVLVVDMPRDAQTNSVYTAYLAALGASAPDDIVYLGVSLVGPRNAVGKLVGRFPLLR
ncbi:DUF2000 domain-containing protein [Nocardiopsis trehalosi]|uniref:DUF2000 domain-containing protein n=1 Tax=Nocardiopsis trehalosi TaxID=109329 RepID=UPI00082D17F9|nr:DUF2000 domain-containing protein [Nocardiopsis trehalosi]